MATIGITALSQCAGGGHATIRVTVNGVERALFDTSVDEVLASIDEQEVALAARLLIRAHAIGKTKAQVATNLAVGLTIVA